MWEQVILNVGIEVYHGENKSNRSGATSGAGAAYPSGALVFTPDFSGVRFFLLVIVLSVSHSPFGIFKVSSDIQQVGKWWYYEKFMGQRCD